MKETVYLAVDKRGVNRMTKNLPALNRGEIPVKLVITVEDTAFREPVIEQEVKIVDWRQGIDIADVDFRESIITDKEAEMIKAQRLQRMKDVLEGRGYKVSEPEARP